MEKIAFVQNLTFEYLGVMYLSSLLKREGHNVQVFIGNNYKKIANSIKDYKAGLVGFPCLTGSHGWCLKAAEEIKSKSRVLTIFGGPHATFFPEIIMKPQVDIVCRGESEQPLLELVSKLEKKEEITNVANCWFKQNGSIIKNEVRPLIDNLDTLPFPDRELYYNKYPFLNASQKVFIAGRGCPFKCSYCFNESMHKLYLNKGRYVRHRSVENVLSEIKMVRSKYGLRTVYMVDDTFINNIKWVSEFLERYAAEVRLPLICLVRLDLITEEVAKKLKKANCYSVFCGIESGNEYLRSQILGKTITDEQIIKGARLLKTNGIKLRAYNMMGIPGETIENAFETVKINVRIKADFPWCAILQPYPRTRIEEYAREKKVLGSDKNTFSASFFRNSPIFLKNINQLISLQKLFYFTVKFPQLLPLVKILIKLPLKHLFHLVFLIGYSYSYRKALNLRLCEYINIGLRNIRILFE